MMGNLVSRSLLRRAWEKSRRGARANVGPAAAILSVGLVLIVFYYGTDTGRAAFDHLARWRMEVGVLFPILTTAFFGGLLPLILRWLFLGQRESLGGIVFYTLFWAEKGWELDLFYRLQAHVWGDDTEWTTVLAKIFTDQVIYGIGIAVPTMLLGYLWRESGFSFTVLRAKLREQGYIERALPVLVSNWVVWIPAVTIIYSFPLALQMPLQNLILTVFVLILLFAAASDPTPSEGSEVATKGTP